MKCPKCGRSWPSEYYFRSSTQCCQCDFEEGIKRPEPERPLFSEEANRSFPDFIQLVAYTLIAINVLSALIEISFLSTYLSSHPNIAQATLWLPIRATYEQIDETPEKALYINSIQNSFVKADTSPGHYPFYLVLIGMIGEPLNIVIFLILLSLNKRIKRGDSFSRRTLTLAKIMAGIAILLGPLEGILGYLIGQQLVTQLSLPGARLDVAFDPNFQLIFMGLVMFCLIRVFQQGIRLQEEHDLTV